MLQEERRELILQITEKSGFVTLQSLSEAIGASESTVRRDLEHLAGIGQIRRTRGGASYVGESLTPFDDRRWQASDQKRQVARAAADLIGSGEAILLDGGTTTLEVARHLRNRSLTVVTNSLPVVNILSHQPEIELILIGGYLYPKTGVALGDHAVRSLQNVHVRRLIMSVGGITQQGLFNSNSLLVETERAMMEAADEVIVVTDSQKLGHPALARLCDLQAVQQIVVDRGITEQWKTIIRKAGIELIVA